ncbi:hypothetical protein ACFY1P_35310 [Streptomyces sp. NPDC001407]|uniref:hypothetical protein n=1 Tax=Streptomyces sp. NPDC001407 TaxID=3364573 RepID=UPI0036BA2A8D
MSLFGKIKGLLGHRSQVQPPVGLAVDQTPANEPPVTPPSSGNNRSEDAGLKNSVARGAAEGAAREAVRNLLEILLGD